MLINLGCSYEKLQYGIKSPIYWNTEKEPHCMISGPTGGGKTVLSQMVINTILENLKNSCAYSAENICICDYKAGGDWDNIVSNYAEYVACDDLLNEFYESFVEAIRQRQRKERYLVFDEFSSYALSKDTKGFKDLMAKISHLAYMSRSFGYHLLFISQQFSSKVIDTAIRDQFAVKIYMGSTISTESATMLFPNCEIDKSIHLPRCCGYISTPEGGLQVIQIPFVSEPAKLKRLLERKGNIK